MVAQRRLRGRLREPAALPARRRRPARAPAPAPMPTALPLPTRAAPSCATTAARRCCSAEDGEARGARAPARCASASARSASTTSTSTCARAGSRRCCRCPACRAWRRRARVRRRRRAGVSGFLPGDRVAYLGPVPGAYCSVRTRAGRLGACGCRPAIEDEMAAATAAEGHHGRLPAARPRPRAARHAAARPRGGRRRRPAGLRLGAPARRRRDRHGVERREGAGRARARLRACDRRRATTASPTRCSAQFGGADVVDRRHRRRGARREPRGAGAPRPLDQPRPGERAAAADRARRAGGEVAHASRVRWCSTTWRRTRSWPSARSASGRRSPTARYGAADRALTARRRRRGARPARIARQRSARWCCSPETPRPEETDDDRRHEPLHRDRRGRAARRWTSTSACSACAVGHRPDLGFAGAWLYGERPQAVLHLYFDRPAAGAARRRDRPHGVHGAATCKRGEGALRPAASIKYDLRRQTARASGSSSPTTRTAPRSSSTSTPAESL